MLTRRMKTMALFTVLILAVHASSLVLAQNQHIPFVQAENYPVVDGSTSTQPLGALIACRLTRTSFAWGTTRMDGTRLLYPTTDEYDDTKALDSDALSSWGHLPIQRLHSSLFNRIRHHGTHPSYKNLIEGKAKLALVARQPSADELQMARNSNVDINFMPIAFDALVFIVNTNNPTVGLSSEQIRSIYTGKITDWQEVGGPAARINAYQRNRNSGSQELMEKLLMEGQEMIPSMDLAVPISMIGPFNALIRDQQGLGYTVWYYNTMMTRLPQVRTIAVDGVAPCVASIGNRTYPLASEVVLAWIDDLAEGSPEQIIRDWLLSDDSSAVIRESGYPPVRNTSEQTPAGDSLKAAPKE